MAYYIAEITPLFGSFELNRGWEPSNSLLKLDETE